LNGIIVDKDNNLYTEEEKKMLGDKIDRDMSENVYMDNKKGGIVRVNKVQFITEIIEKNVCVENYDFNKIIEIEEDKSIRIKQFRVTEDNKPKEDLDKYIKIRKTTNPTKKDSKIVFSNQGIDD